MNYPIKEIRSDFPILSEKINNSPLIYLDNAASSQKPKCVLQREIIYSSKEHSAVHRGIHTLSKNATKNMEDIRSKIAKFINAKSDSEIIFVKGTTEGINLVANTWGETFIKKGDNIVITQMEHHANIVPWQLLSMRKKVDIKYIPLLPSGKLDICKIDDIINNNTRIFCITHVSNILGTCNLIEKIIKKIKNNYDIKVLIDGAQAIMHMKIDVQKIDCDFYVFSGHKIYGPSGIGVLYGKKKLLKKMPPWEGGGGMIKKVCLFSGTTFNEIPWRFEAGSPNISGIIGLGKSIEYVKKIGIKKIQKYEKKLIKYALLKIKNIPNIKIYSSETNTSIIPFNLKGCHSYDVGILLDKYGVAIRTGHHCSMPIMNFFKVHSMCRISVAMYSDESDIDNFIKSLLKVQKFLRRFN